MKRTLFIGCGGLLGAIIRFHGKGVALPYQGPLPLNTLLTNLLGCFLLALILTLAYEVLEMDTNLRLGIATGFLGALTTFSTLCKETYQLASEGSPHFALLYLLLSTVLGIGAVYAGLWTARVLIGKRSFRQEVD